LLPYFPWEGEEEEEEWDLPTDPAIIPAKKCREFGFSKGTRKIA